MLAFLTEWLFVGAMLLAFGGVGGFAVAPFRQCRPHIILASPFAGLLVMAFGMSVGYQLLGQPFLVSVIATAAAGALATAWTVYRVGLHVDRRSLTYTGGLAILVAGIVAATTASASIEVGGPALHYWTGTDHLGYTHPADWMIAHPPWDLPRIDPSVPYESWPALMLEWDPRFGSLALVALVAVVRGIPATFAYDAACAITLSAAALGVAALFARSRLSLCLLVLGLLTCHWYDYGRAGYLGRLLGYPSAGLVIGMLLATKAPLHPRALIPILLVAAGAASVYVADATVLFIGVIGGTFVLASLVLCREPMIRRLRCLPWQHVVVLALIAVVALAAKNGVAKRWSPDAGGGGSLRTAVNNLIDPSVETGMFEPPWEEIRPTLLDLEQAHAPIRMLPRDPLNAAIFVARVIWLALIVAAVLRRDPAALALTLGPLLLLTMLNALDSPFARWVTAQLPGTFYPFMLAGAALLLDGAAVRDGRRLAGRAAVVALTALTIVSVGLRVPRFVGAVDRYVGTGTRTLPPFSLAEIDGLAETIGSEPVRIDLEEPHLVLIALVELGRRGTEIEWGPRAWFHVASYRGWPVPEATTPARLILEAFDEPPDDRGTVLYATRQYRLVRIEPARRP